MIDCFIPLVNEEDFNATQHELEQCALVSHIYPIGIDKPQSSATMKWIGETTEANYTLLYTKGSPLKLGLFALERMVQLAKHQYPSSNVRITLETVQEDLMAFADESMMTQVLTNLLKNAIQAIGEAKEGEIRLRAYCDAQDVVRIEVSNNGPRIAPEIAEQMFVPFFTTKKEGSGIGLSLSKQMMRLQGGNVSLHPYRDEWTTFVVTLN